MTGRRCKEEIIAQILSICLEDTNKTKIADATCMNFQSMNEYLDLLTKSGLLEEHIGIQRIYRTTKKGIGILDHLKTIHEQIQKQTR
jgi:predicted transcriptional regulator